MTSATTSHEFSRRRAARLPVTLLLCLAILALLIGAAGCSGESPTPTPTTTLEPPPPTATPVVETFFKVTETGGLGLNIRENPNASSGVVARACEGAVLEVKGEPVEGDEYTWVEIVGYGFAVDDFLRPTKGPATTDEATDGFITLICPR